MRFASTTGPLAAALLAVASAAPSSPPKIPGKCQIETPATPAFNAHPPFAPSSPVMSLRGGAVLEPKTLGEVDGILLKASAEGKLVVIDFSATWCGPCKMIAPLFLELSEDMPSVVFLKVDVDENPDTAAKYGVSAMPTFIFIKKGEVIDRLMGANPAALQEKCSDLA